ncbi:MAG: hypothetical protein AAF770_01420 [Bacteroidota bacterium]
MALVKLLKRKRKKSTQKRRTEEVGKLTEELEKSWYPVAIKLYSEKSKKKP